MSNFTKCYRLVLLSFFHRSQSLSRTVVCGLVMIVSHGISIHAGLSFYPTVFRSAALSVNFCPGNGNLRRYCTATGMVTGNIWPAWRRHTYVFYCRTCSR